MIRWTIKVALLLTLCSTCGIAAVRFWQPRTAARSEHSGILVLDFERLATLTVLRVPVSDVVEERLSGYTGGIAILLRVRGELLMGVDMTKARIVHQDDMKRKLRLSLPRPHCLVHKLDHEGTSLYSIDRQGLWVLTPLQRPTAVATNRAFRSAEAFVAEAGRKPDVVGEAQRHAEFILHATLRDAGWTLEIDWQQ